MDKKKYVKPGYIEIRQPDTNKLLFRFDPVRDLIEIKVRDIITVIDLAQHRQKAMVGGD